MKNCGSCKWWKRWPKKTDIGDCMHEGPYLVPASIRMKGRDEMYPNEGTDCPCYTAKETECKVDTDEASVK